MSRDILFYGWYFKSRGMTIGPVSVEDLRDLLGKGYIRPSQAVWRHSAQGWIFVHAERAATSPPAPAERAWRSAS
jgi:hypothetical protein